MPFIDWTILLLIPGLVMGSWAQNKLKKAYDKYSNVPTKTGFAASTVAADMLLRNGNDKVTVHPVQGLMTDHYNPLNETLNLSDGVYGSPSVAALGIAAHETGHAMQRKDGYFFLIVRMLLAPLVTIAQALSTPVMLAALIFTWPIIFKIGIWIFAVTTAFSLVSLPVEFNASRRAIKMLRAGGYISEDEVPAVREVLTAAALTYVAGAVSSLLQLIRLIILSKRNK